MRQEHESRDRVLEDVARHPTHEHFTQSAMGIGTHDQRRGRHAAQRLSETVPRLLMKHAIVIVSDWPIRDRVPGVERSQSHRLTWVEISTAREPERPWSLRARRNAAKRCGVC